MGRALAVAILLLSATSALAQTPREVPQDGYGLHDERTVGPFTVQRWVNSNMPEVSPSGMCECITVVYEGERRVTTFGRAGTLSAFTTSDLSGTVERWGPTIRVRRSCDWMTGTIHPVQILCRPPPRVRLVPSHLPSTR